MSLVRVTLISTGSHKVWVCFLESWNHRVRDLTSFFNVSCFYFQSPNLPLSLSREYLTDPWPRIHFKNVWVKDRHAQLSPCPRQLPPILSFCAIKALFGSDTPFVIEIVMILRICLESLHIESNCSVILFSVTSSIPGTSKMPSFLLVECHCGQEAVQQTKFGIELWETES